MKPYTKVLYGCKTYFTVKGALHKMNEQLNPEKKVEKREKYRKWINWSVGIGITSSLVATAVWMITEEQVALFIGLGMYWLGAIGMGMGYWLSPVQLRDEFERQMESKANQTVSAFIAVVTIIGIPADVVLSTTDVYTIPPTIRGVIWGYLVLVFIFGISHWYVKRSYK